jgi:hypothetical protein
MTHRPASGLRRSTPVLLVVALLWTIAQALPSRAAPAAAPADATATPTEPAPPTSPASVEVIGQLGGPATAIAVRGSIGYAGVGARLVVLEAGDDGPVRTLAETPPVAGMIADIALDGDRAVLVTDQAELIIVDVHDPLRPATVGRTQLVPPPPEGLAITSVGTREVPALVIAGHLAYVTAVQHGLFLVDLRDVRNPAVVGHVDAPSGADRRMVDVAVTDVPGVGRRALVAAEAAGLLIYDVADPSAPPGGGRMRSTRPVGGPTWQSGTHPSGSTTSPSRSSIARRSSWST